MSHTLYIVLSAIRDRPYLFFFDITKCVSAATVGQVVQGQVDTSSIFTCPTQQVSCDNFPNNCYSKYVCTMSIFLHQVCVDRCPAANEFGVRNNPVCIDSVDTSGFVDITNGNPADIATRVSVRKSVAYNPA